MHRSKIEWVRNPDNKTLGWGWNPLTGCLNHTPDGLCLGGMFPCYACKLAHGRLKQRYLANCNVPPIDTKELLTLEQAGELQTRLQDPFYPRFWENRFQDFGSPDSYGYQKILKPKGIFVCDMGELFGDWVPSEWQKLIFNYIKDYPEHRFYLLTKQPQNLSQFSPFPDNCWVGVTVTSNGAMTIALTNLANIQASKRFISFEPLLGAIGMNDHMNMKGIIDWIIIGAQTKPYKPPKIEWVEDIVRAADKAGIPVFLKDNLAQLLLNLSIHDANAGLVDSLLDNAGRLRQELPNGTATSS